MKSFTKFQVSAIIAIGLITACQDRQAPEMPNSSAEPDSPAFVDLLYQHCVLDPEEEASPDLIQHMKYGRADLSGDGHQEIVVLVQHRDYCGSGGCTGFVCDSQGMRLSRMTVTDEPVLLSDHTTNGWKDFYVWSNGSLRVMAYDGKRYPNNPSMEPKYNRSAQQNAAEERVKQEEIYVQDGYQLKLVDDIPILQPAHVYAFSFLHYGDPEVQYLMTIDMKTELVEMNSRQLDISPVK